MPRTLPKKRTELSFLPCCSLCIDTKTRCASSRDTPTPAISKKPISSVTFGILSSASSSASASAEGAARRALVAVCHALALSASGDASGAAADAGVKWPAFASSETLSKTSSASAGLPARIRASTSVMWLYTDTPLSSILLR